MKPSQQTYDATIISDVAGRATSWVINRYPGVAPLLAHYGVCADDSRPLPEAAAANGFAASDVLHEVIDHILRPIPWH